MTGSVVCKLWLFDVRCSCFLSVQICEWLNAMMSYTHIKMSCGGWLGSPGMMMLRHVWFSAARCGRQLVIVRVMNQVSGPLDAQLVFSMINRYNNTAKEKKSKRNKQINKKKQTAICMLPMQTLHRENYCECEFYTFNFDSINRSTSIT